MSSFLIWLWLNLLWLILKLIHLSYSGYEFLDIGWLIVRRKFKNFSYLSVFDSKTFVSDFVKKLEKCPSHFVVILGEDDISLKDFSNFVIWCLAAKISFISFYDYTGFLKKNRYIYYQYLVKKKKIDPNSVVFDLEKQSNQNGILTKIHLNILSLEDGKPLFVKVAKKLSQNVISNTLQISEVNEKLITNQLYEQMRLPEPDLCVVCGKTFGTLGFLPWHIRVTEFVQTKNLSGMKAWEFASILMSYSSCTQKFGK